MLINKKIKNIFYFFLEKPSKYFVFSVFLRAWTLLGLSVTSAILLSYFSPTAPLYSELTCQSGSLIKIGKKRIGKKRMDYLELKINDNKRELYFGGVFYHDIDHLKELIGKPMTVCFHEARTRLAYFNQYVEVIYQNGRTMNSYEGRRQHYLKVIEKSKRKFVLTFFWWVVLPLTITIYILKKYK